MAAFSYQAHGNHPLRALLTVQPVKPEPISLIPGKGLTAIKRAKCPIRFPVLGWLVVS